VLGFKKGWVMGISPLFDWGEANALFFGKILLNQYRQIKD